MVYPAVIKRRGDNLLSPENTNKSHAITITHSYGYPRVTETAKMTKCINSKPPKATFGSFVKATLKAKHPFCTLQKELLS